MAKTPRNAPKKSAPTVNAASAPNAVPPGDAWAVPATKAALALFAVVLGWWVVAHHPIGDYFTESDFYEYARGGARIRGGLVEPARYVIIGPLYEFVLAAIGLFTRDVFGAAKLVSVGSAIAVAGCWSGLARERIRPLAGFAVVLLLATNPAFFRYGHSASTDLLALALQAVSAYLLLSPRNGSPVRAGVFAALATLTRYVGLFLVPVAALVLLRRANGRAAFARWAIGFAIVAAPWTAYSLAKGHAPAEGLFANFAFYSNETASRNVQDLTPGERLQAPVAAEPFAAMIARRTLEHTRRDALELTGVLFFALAVAGAAVSLRARASGGARAFAAWAAASWGLLLASFYSDRYSLTMLPAYAALAGTALAALWTVRARAGAVAALALLALVPFTAARATRALVRGLERDLPVEALDAAAALRRERPSGAVVLARKAAVAHFAGATALPFTPVTTLPELASLAREGGATHLWYSWYEGELRSEFWYLLDTTTTVPGLRRIASTTHHDGVLYAIEPGFGEVPAWFADPDERRMRELAGHVRALHGEGAAALRRQLADWYDARGESAFAQAQRREAEAASAGGFGR